MAFKTVSSQVNFPALEEEILKFWKENRIFEKSIENRKGKKRFVFYEGPPTANGKPHMGHALQRSLKDLILRFRTMKGYLVERRAGWDTHGLPVEIQVEKELGLKGKQDILTLKENEFESIKYFNQKCQESVFRYVDDWTNFTNRIGFWIDFDNAYVTYDNNYIESVWWFLSEVNKKGLLYKDYKVVPYCSRCGTSLSSHELALGYKDDTEDPSIFVKFELINQPGTFLLVWTTTPWTLPGNIALAVGKNINYIKVEQNGQYYILAKKRLNVLDEDYKVVEEIRSQDLIDQSYKPLYEYLKPEGKAYFITEADFATDEEGTGIVHTAVMYGTDDFELGKRLGLSMKHIVNTKGEFTDEVEDFKGLFVKDSDKKITEDLNKRGLLYKEGIIKHTYPFCWRCETPIVYYALEAWFIKTTAVREKLLEDNQKINWVPKTIKTGRMKNWLESLVDWNISRNRFWGTPLPIWLCDNGHIQVTSREEIEKLGGKVPDDLHKPYIDKVTFNCPDCQDLMKRIPDVADVWMDSGAMPFAQWHYPFENQNAYSEWYPADYIVEGIDQTRGWFFTLMAEAMLQGSEPPAPFRNVISTGLILDEKGQKMSKSKGNIVDPMDMIPISGADSMRMYMYTGAPAGGNYLFSKELLQEKQRRFLLILWNCYKFFVDYANLAGWTYSSDQELKFTALDEWIKHKLNKLCMNVNDNLEKYNATDASREIEEFVVKDLSTWYIRRSRDRVGPGADTTDQQIFLSTLYDVLHKLCRLSAPFIPYTSEEIFRNLTDRESVHLSDYPEGEATFDHPELSEGMNLVRQIAELAHAKRKEAGIKLRQPLASLVYNVSQKLDSQQEQILAEEVNVKKIEYEKSSDKEPKVELETKITQELAKEGEARELIRQIQSLRKEMNLTLADKTKIEAPKWPKEYEKQILSRSASISITQGNELKISKLNDQ